MSLKTALIDVKTRVKSLGIDEEAYEALEEALEEFIHEFEYAKKQANQGFVYEAYGILLNAIEEE